MEGSACDEDNEDFCCMKCQDMPEIDRMVDEPSKVIEDTLKDIKVAVKALEWTELKIWANTKALNTRVLMIRFQEYQGRGNE